MEELNKCISEQRKMIEMLNEKIEKYEVILKSLGYKKFEKCISCEFIACENHQKCLKQQ